MILLLIILIIDAPAALTTFTLLAGLNGVHASPELPHPSHLVRKSFRKVVQRHGLVAHQSLLSAGAQLHNEPYSVQPGTHVVITAPWDGQQ